MADRLPDVLLAGDPAHAGARNRRERADAELRRAHRRVDVLAGRLASLGVGRGSRVALVLPDGPEFLQLLLAVAALGATAAPLNPAYKRDEYAFYLDDLQPAAAARPRGRAARRRARRRDAVRRRRRRRRRRRDRARGRRRSRRAPRIEPAAAGRRRAAPAHERHDQPARSRCRCSQRNLDGVGADDRRASTGSARTTSRTARCRSSTSTASSPRRSPRWPAAARVVVPRRFAPRAFWPQAREHGVDLVLRRADAAPDDPRPHRRRRARPRRCASPARAARRSRPR